MKMELLMVRIALDLIQTGIHGAQANTDGLLEYKEELLQAQRNIREQRGAMEVRILYRIC